MPTWSARLAIGVPMIDAQHQQLFGRADALLAAMKEHRSRPEVLALLQFLETYVDEHFGAEEALLRERLPGALASHAAAHQVFRKRFGALAARVRDDGPGPTVTLDLQQLVAGWLVNHVSSLDQDLALRDLVGLDEDPPGAIAPGQPAAHPASDFTPVTVTHRGVPVLRLDFRGLEPASLVEAFDIAGDRIRSAPHASLRILTLLESSLTTACAAAFKAYALRNRPHVFASALVGDAFWRVIVADLQARGRDDLVVFDDAQAALDWLAAR